MQSLPPSLSAKLQRAARRACRARYATLAGALRHRRQFMIRKPLDLPPAVARAVRHHLM